MTKGPSTGWTAASAAWSAYYSSMRRRLTRRSTTIASTRCTASASSPVSVVMASTRRVRPSCHPSGPKSDKPARPRARSRRTSTAAFMNCSDVIVAAKSAHPVAADTHGEEENMNDQAKDASPFAVAGRVPSSALIEKVLRAVPDAPDTTLDEHTVDMLCRRLRESAQLLSEFTLTSKPPDRAESFRYLLLMLAYAIDAGLLNPDPLEPMFSQPYRLHLLDWGGASPDSVYRRAMLRDDRSYRIYGRLGNAKYFSIDFRQS